jgi:hypothetical protein
MGLWFLVPSATPAVRQAVVEQVASAGRATPVAWVESVTASQGRQGARAVGAANLMLAKSVHLAVDWLACKPAAQFQAERLPLAGW